MLSTQHIYAAASCGCCAPIKSSPCARRCNLRCWHASLAPARRRDIASRLRRGSLLPA